MGPQPLMKIEVLKRNLENLNLIHWCKLIKICLVPVEYLKRCKTFQNEVPDHVHHFCPSSFKSGQKYAPDGICGTQCVPVRLRGVGIHALAICGILICIHWESRDTESNRLY